MAPHNSPAVPEASGSPGPPASHACLRPLDPSGTDQTVCPGAVLMGSASPRLPPLALRPPLPRPHTPAMCLDTPGPRRVGNGILQVGWAGRQALRFPCILACTLDFAVRGGQCSGCLCRTMGLPGPAFVLVAVTGPPCALGLGLGLQDSEPAEGGRGLGNVPAPGDELRPD